MADPCKSISNQRYRCKAPPSAGDDAGNQATDQQSRPDEMQPAVAAIGMFGKIIGIETPECLILFFSTHCYCAKRDCKKLLMIFV